MKKIFFLLFILTTYISYGQSADTLTYPIDKKCEQCLNSALTRTSDMMNCFATARDSWSKEVIKYYKLLMTKLKPGQKEKLLSAQKEWTAYKEKEFQLCNYIYYDEEQGHEKRIDAVSRQSQIVRQRALGLMQYYDLFLEK